MIGSRAPWIVALFVLLASNSAFAAGETRVFVVNHHLQRNDMNGFLDNQNLTSFPVLPGVGFETVVRPAGGPAGVGLRVQYHRLHVGVPHDAAGSDFSRLHSFNMQAVFRAMLIEQDFFRADIYGGGGPTWASLTTRKSGVESSYELAPFDMRWMFSAGGSLQFGFNPVYVIVEGGYEWNNVDSLTKKTNPVGHGPNRLDLSGPFISAGLAFRIQ